MVGALDAYLMLINAAAFLAAAADYRLCAKAGRGAGGAGALSLLAVAGGGPGLMLASLIWDRKVVKDNVAWRFVALFFTAIWALALPLVYGAVRLEASALMAPVEEKRMLPLAIYLVFANAVAFALFAADKRRARRGQTRIREAVLLGCAMGGGAPGAILALHLCHHKTRVWYFRYGMPAMLALQIVALLYAKAAVIA